MEAELAAQGCSARCSRRRGGATTAAVSPELRGWRRATTPVYEESARAASASVGKPGGWIEVRIVDGAGQSVPEGAVGELIVRSPGLMLGYLDDPEANAITLRDGWYHTGDNARRDAQGYYYLLGRRGIQINVGGQKVAPEEVEAVLLLHPGVREAVVVPQPDVLRGEVVRAIVVPEGAAPGMQELRRFCRAQLAGYKVPRAIEFRSEPLPRSALGKVLRQQL
ncbi:MAG: AMP-binding protein [Chloroflexia bacterium]